MGLYDQFMLPTSGEYISTYAGLPIAETAALGEVINKNYREGIEGVSAFNVMRDNVQVDDADMEMKDQAFDDAGSFLKEYAEQGNFEDAYPAIVRATSMVSGNKNLRKAMLEYKEKQDHAELAEKLFSTRKINRDQYLKMLSDLNEYTGVSNNDSISKHKFMPSDPISIYDEMVDIMKEVQPHETQSKFWDSDINQWGYRTTSEINKDELIAAGESAFKNNPKIQAYYQDMVHMYGPDRAAAMMAEEMNAASNAVYDGQKHKDQYKAISEVGRNVGGSIRFGRTPVQNMNITDYNQLRDDHYDLKADYDRKLGILNVAKEQGATNTAEQEAIVEAAKKKLDNSAEDLASMIDISTEGFNWEGAYAEFRAKVDQEIANLGEYEGEDKAVREKVLNELPATLDGYKALLKDGAAETATWGEGITDTISGIFNQYSLIHDQISDLQDVVHENMEDGITGIQGYTLSGNSSTNVNKINSAITNDWQNGRAGGMITYFGDNDIDAHLADNFPHRDTNSETLTMTTLLDDNGNNVWQLSFMDKSLEGKNLGRKNILISSADQLISADMNMEVENEMIKIAQDPTATGADRVIASQYLAQMRYLPEMRKQKIYNKGIVELGKITGGSSATVQKLGDRIYELKILDANGDLVESKRLDSPERVAMVLGDLDAKERAKKEKESK